MRYSWQVKVGVRLMEFLYSVKVTEYGPDHLRMENAGQVVIFPKNATFRQMRPNNKSKFQFKG